MLLRRLVLAVVAMGAGVALACGPSFHAIYEGDARFEHCYALEENPQSPMREKGECWRDWSEHYTYGQTRDRIQYAIARYVALSQTANIPTDEAMMNAAPGVTPRVSNITAPAPTNAFAPPPKVLGEADAQPPRPTEIPRILSAQRDAAPSSVTPPPPAPPPAGPDLPAHDCTSKCKVAFEACPAGADAGKATKNDSCEKVYKGCMKGCFK